MIILRPIPSLIIGEIPTESTLEPNIHVANFGAWFSGLLAGAPSAYTTIDEYLKQVMPDLKDIKNPPVGIDISKPSRPILQRPGKRKASF